MKLPTRLVVGLLVISILTIGYVCCEDEDVGIVEEEEELPVNEEVKLEKPKYSKPVAKGNTFFTETFESPAEFMKRWIQSEAKKDDADEAIAKYDGQWKVEEPEDNPIEGDLTLVLKSRAKHHAISSILDKSYEFIGKPFVMQYEVRFKNGQECGGAYVKLLTKDNKLDLKKFTDKTGYTIMFGPDKCGNDNKLHFIFRHKHPITGKFEEKHAKKPTSSIDSFFTDKMTHLYTLVVSPDNTFEVFVDQNLINSGSLLDDMTPPVNPAKEIVDPDDKKPEDWDEREKIPDPEATKPDDWDEDEPEMIPDADAKKPEGWLDDEPELIPDPDAETPSDWDEDMDGEWEPPMITNPACENAPGCGEWEPPQVKNPKYKGKWKPPMIENPNYKGKWKPRKIPNPDYFEDKEPYKMTSIGAIGLELWSMSDEIIFDNFIITDDKAVADQWAADTWSIKHKQEKAGNSASRSVVDAVLDATNERPWLWAVFIVVILLPIILVIAYCCMPGSSKPEHLHPKKTDEPMPDDEITDEKINESEVANDQAAGDAKKDASPSVKATKPKKSDLEAEEEENEADNEDEDASKQNRSTRSRKMKARKD